MLAPDGPRFDEDVLRAVSRVVADQEAREDEHHTLEHKHERRVLPGRPARGEVVRQLDVGGGGGGGGLVYAGTVLLAVVMFRVVLS